MGKNIKKTKRKLIGFLAGEKGSIGKLQALGLGMFSIFASGLILPEDTEASAHSDGVYGDDGPPQHGDWDYNSWSDGGNDYEYTDGGWSNYADSPHSDHDDYDDYWSGDWQNAKPSVEIDVQ